MNWGDDHNNDYAEGTVLPHNKNSSYDLNSKIMLTAIISLSLVVTLVVVLHIYARYVLRRNTRHQRATLAQLNSTSTDHNQPIKRGLDPTVISSLPIFVYEQNDGQDSIECAVCLSLLEDQDTCRVLPNCKHSFHAECIDKWLSSHPSCPICRTEAEPMPEPFVDGGAAASVPPLEATTSLSSAKSSESSTRLSSIRRLISVKERSSRRIQSIEEDHEDGEQGLQMP